MSVKRGEGEGQERAVLWGRQLAGLTGMMGIPAEMLLCTVTASTVRDRVQSVVASPPD